MLVGDGMADFFGIEIMRADCVGPFVDCVGIDAVVHGNSLTRD